MAMQAEEKQNALFVRYLYEFILNMYMYTIEALNTKLLFVWEMYAQLCNSNSKEIIKNSANSRIIIYALTTEIFFLYINITNCNRNRYFILLTF